MRASFSFNSHAGKPFPDNVLCISGSAPSLLGEFTMSLWFSDGRLCGAIQLLRELSYFANLPNLQENKSHPDRPNYHNHLLRNNKDNKLEG